MSYENSLLLKGIALQQHRLGVRLTPIFALVVALGQIGGLRVARAESSNTFVATASANGASSAQTTSGPLDLVVNTDGGVDDSAALDWLLSQKNYPVDVLGISATAGVTTVNNAANNVLTVLDALGQQNVPVAVGASAPLSEPLSQTGSLLHGPDGLWFVGEQHPHNLSGLSHDVPSFYNDLTQAAPGATLLSLGPLTNLAQTWEEYPNALKSFKQIVVLGGAINGGNITPNAEFNIWQDPEAANILLSSGLPITLVPLDAFKNFTLTAADLQTLQTQGNQATKLISGPLQDYAAVQTGVGGSTNASFPDVSAAIYAVDSSLGTSQSALVKVDTDPGLARGETVVSLTPSQRISLIASDAELSQLAKQAFSDPNFNIQAAEEAILAREPDNANIVTAINSQQMHDLFLNALTTDPPAVPKLSTDPVAVPDPFSVLDIAAIAVLEAATALKRKQKVGSSRQSQAECQRQVLPLMMGGEPRLLAEPRDRAQSPGVVRDSLDGDLPSMHVSPTLELL
ncbi:MAG: nucleoside hydrolase [Chroococcidiopsidaceae cyanobacterium CP_BM_ER_R8_30]|nr:nucleoside hydrolase [Chroococcidiopsidaceae cyanobacterium CP_BM_ER_R8_30]